MSALPSALPSAISSAIWRGAAMGSTAAQVIPTGWEAFDRELPGSGWPCRTVCELLQAQPAVLEWRLLGPALRTVTTAGGSLIAIGPPQQLHAPGLRLMGIDERQLIWIQAEPPAERLWVTEQVIRAGSGAAVVAWLPQARPEQLRRLQIAAQASDGWVVICRPEAARLEASAAPLRVQACIDLDWSLQVQIVKRRGPPLDSSITLPSVPGGLSAVLTPRLRQPSRLFHRAALHAVGRPPREFRQDATV